MDMTSGASVASRFPLTLALSPRGRGEGRLQGQGTAPGVALADPSYRGLPLPPGESAGVRGRQPC